MAKKEIVTQEEKAEVVIKPADSISAVDTMTAEEYQEWLALEGIALEEFDGGSEWELVGDKDTLLNRAFIIARLRFTDNEKGKFVSVCAYAAPDGKKIVFNDGGTGIYQQLLAFVKKHNRTTGIRCSNGLRVSRYDYTDDEGVTRDAATYYIA